MNNLGIIHVSSQNIPRIIKGLTFSAAMNSSRSDIVTQFVRSSVTKEFFRSASSSRNRSAKKKKIEKVSNCYDLISLAFPSTQWWIQTIYPIGST